MKLIKLTKENLAKKGNRGVATVSFSDRGIVVLSLQALRKLEITQSDSVDVFQGDIPSEFSIAKGTTYKLRRNGNGGAVFNNKDLCQLVREKSWLVTSHDYGEKIPNTLRFNICEKPVDDEENAHVYALLRKKA